MKPEVEAAFGDLVQAQVKAERAKDRRAKAQQELDQAMAVQTEAINYLDRCKARMEELSRGEGREVIRMQTAQQQQQAVAPKPSPVVIPPQQRQKR